jgi:hypothetical protein
MIQRPALVTGRRRDRPASPRHHGWAARSARRISSARTIPTLAQVCFAGGSGDLCDLGEPLRPGDHLGRGLVRRRPTGRELLLVGLPCCGPFARQGGQSGYRAVGSFAVQQ